MLKIFDRKASENEITGNIRTKLAFQQLWVNGSLGAFFIAIARTLPGDVDRLSNPPLHVFPSDLLAVTLLRYAYLIWLIWYFFLSNLRRPDEKTFVNEIFFDVIQSILCLTAAFFLDFVAAGTHHSVQVGFALANAAIFLFAGLAWVWFPSDTKLQGIRAAGALIAALAFIVGVVLPGRVRDWEVAAVLAVFLIGLYVVLSKFHSERIKEIDPPQAATARTVA